jgi:hypothetical protein
MTRTALSNYSFNMHTYLPPVDRSISPASFSIPSLIPCSTPAPIRLAYTSACSQASVIPWVSRVFSSPKSPNFQEKRATAPRRRGVAGLQ